MKNETAARDFLDSAKEMSLMPIPLAPYWDGQKFDESLEIPLHESYSESEWDAIFETFTEGLQQNDWQMRSAMMERLRTSLQAEIEQNKDDKAAQKLVAPKRLPRILQIVTERSVVAPEIFEEFCDAFKRSDDEKLIRVLVLAWLKRLRKNAPQIGDEKVLAAQILFGEMGFVWSEAGEKLLSLLDHNDLTVRACAANQIGLFYSRAQDIEEPTSWKRRHPVSARRKAAVEGLPPRDEMFETVKQKEIARPGIAGAFWYGCRDGMGDVVDADEWILEILTESPSPEPYIRYFSCDLAFDAHERFSRDANAIRRLMNAGLEGLAIAAATDESQKIAELEPLLRKMGFSDNVEVARLAAWHLAYHYGVLHPNGEKLGFVEFVSHLPEIDLFLLHSRDSRNDSPYTAVIYAKDRKPLEREFAQKWVDMIFPAKLRGKAQTPSWMDNEDHPYFKRGFISYEENNVSIGYRSDKKWNPKELLL